MAEENKTDQANPDADTQSAIAARTDAAATSAAQPNTDQYITRDAFASMQREMMEQFSQMTERLVASVRPQATQEVRKPVDYDALIREADEAGDSQRATDLRIAKGQQPLLQRINELEQNGANAISQLAISTLTEKDRKIYNRYRKEVDGYLSTVSPEARANPQTLNAFIKVVRGEHHEELLSEEREAWNREVTERNKTTSAIPSTTESSRNRGTGGAPTPEDVYTPEQLEQIEAKGGIDVYVRKLSNGKYKNWSEYIARPIAAQVLKIKPKEKAA